MNYKIGEVVIIDGCPQKYLISDQHRGSSNVKSLWIISIEMEVSCFQSTIDKNWIFKSHRWGACVDSSDDLMVLGVNRNSEKLKIAKFVNPNKNNVWHGYPADYRRNTQDRPPMYILKSWLSDGIIKKHQIAKILGGKICNL